MSFEPGHFLSDGLGAFAESWESDFRRCWGLDAEEPPEDLTREEWVGIKLMYAVSQSLLRAARSLERGDLKYDQLVTLFLETTGGEPREVEFVRQCLDVLLARGIGYDLYLQRRRVFDLLEVLVEVRSERSRAYLLRLARCYLYGMVPEGSVMARAVLDTALQDVVEDRDVQYAGNAKSTRHVDLDDRLTHLKRKQLISREALEAADEIRENGNRAIHLAPGVAGDLASTLRQLKLVLSELEFLE